MSFLPLSYSTTSLSSAHSGYFTDASDSTGYTSDDRRDSACGVKGTSSAGGDEDECVDSDEQEKEMEKFLLGPGWHDHRVPPAERLKHLYRLLQEHFDMTGGDYYGQNALYVRGTAGGSRGNTQLEGYPFTCMAYLTRIGVNLDFLENSDDVSPNPMDDLINEAFQHPTSLSPIYKYRAGPITTWEIDWSRPLPGTTQAYWEMMRRTRSKPVHEFTRAKPLAGPPRVNPRPYYRQEDFPQHYDVENDDSTNRTFRTVLFKVRGLFASH